MARREVEVGEGVGLGLLRGLGAASLQHLAGHVVQGRDGRDVLGTEDRGDDADHAAPELPGTGLAPARIFIAVPILS